MAQAINPTSMVVIEDALALKIPGSKETRVRVHRGAEVRLTHKYSTAFYGTLSDGTPVWLDRKCLQFGSNGDEVNTSKIVGDNIEERKEADEDASGALGKIAKAGKSRNKNKLEKAEQNGAQKAIDHDVSSPRAQGPEIMALAVHSFDASGQAIPSGLDVTKGDRLGVLGQEGNWYFGVNLKTGLNGIFPKTFVRLLDAAEVDAFRRNQRRQSILRDESMLKEARKKATEESNEQQQDQEYTDESDDEDDKSTTSSTTSVPSEVGHAEKLTVGDSTTIVEHMHEESDTSSSTSESSEEESSEEESSNKEGHLGPSQEGQQQERYMKFDEYASSSGKTIRRYSQPRTRSATPVEPLHITKDNQIEEPVKRSLVHQPEQILSQVRLDEKDVAQLGVGPKSLLSLCQEALAAQSETDLVTKAVMENFRAHCSRSFAYVMLRDRQREKRESEDREKKLKANFLAQIEKEHEVLLDEIDRLSSGKALADMAERLRVCERQLSEKDETIKHYHKKVRDLQGQLAKAENEKWLDSETSFLDTKSSKELSQEHAKLTGGDQWRGWKMSP